MNQFQLSFLDAIKQVADRNKKYLESLKDLPFECDTIPSADFKQLRSVNALSKAAVEKYERESKALEFIYGANGQLNPEEFLRAKKGMEQKIIFDLMSVFDKLDVWSYKFSTESQGTGDNLRETPDDSIYYMTSHGVSIRFKMANREKGIEKVLQPMMEKIFFMRYRDEDLSETPKLGYHVTEYATPEFFDALRNEVAGEDYKSSIRKYKRGDKTEIPKFKNIKRSHDGSPVNKIFFSK